MGIFKKKETYPYAQLRNLVVGLLKELSCQPVVDEYENVAFTYQGEHFLMIMDAEGCFSIFDLWWLEMNLDDEDASFLFNSIKEANSYSTYNVTYRIEDNIVHVASRYRMIVCFDEDRNPILTANALGFALDEAFRTKRYLTSEFDKLKNNE